MTLRQRGGSVHQQIRTCILAGEWVPGEKLQPGLLAERYSTSTTVVREALTRMSGENFVVMRPHRGFFVPELSLDELRDITEVRCRSESFALELALERGDLAWESSLIAAHHRLAHTPRRSSDDPSHIAEAWSVAHRQFHHELIASCKVPVLIDLARQLDDTIALYRRWAAPSDAAVSRDVEAEHQRILDAAVARDSVVAAALLRAHYETTMDVILVSGLVDGVG